MSDTLPRYRRAVPLTRVRVADAVAPAAVTSDAMTRLAAAFEAAGARYEEQTRPRRVAEAERAAGEWRAQRDEAGRLVPPELRNTGRAEDLRYDAIVTQAWSSAFQNDNQQAAVELRRAAGNDPEAFRRAWTGRVDGLLAEVPEAWRGPATQALTDIGDQHYRNILGQRIQRDEANARAAWDHARQADEEDLNRLAEAGRMGAPEWDETWARYQDRLRLGVEAGSIAQEEAERLTQDARAAGTLRGVVHNLLARGLGRESALAAFDREATGISLPENERHALRGRLSAELSARAAAGAVYRAELRGQAQDVLARQRLGVPVRPAEFRALAARAARAGETGLAEALGREANIAVAVDGWRAAPVAQIAAEAVRLRASPDATREDAELAQRLAETAEKRAADLRRDALETGARIHAERVGPLAPIPWSDPAQAAEALGARTRQAALVAQIEGVPVAPLTAPEAETLARQLETAPPEQQGALMDTLARGLGDEGMRSVLGMIQPGTDARDTRQALVAAGVIWREDPRQAVRLLQGAALLAENRVPALGGAEVDRTIRETLGEALAGAAPDALATITAAVRARYAEEAAGNARLANDLDARRLSELVEEYFPTLRFHDARIPAPARGVDETAFAEMLAVLPAEALGGARAADGTPFTVEMLRRRGARLVGVASGRYRVLWGEQEVLGPAGAPFVLDLRDAGVPQGMLRPEGGERRGALRHRLAPIEGFAPEPVPTDATPAGGSIQ